MKTQELRKVSLMTPFYDEEKAKTQVERKKIFGKSSKWISSIPLYIPYWQASVVMELFHKRKNKMVKQVFPTLVNGFTKRALIVDGVINIQHKNIEGIFLDTLLNEAEVQEAASVEVLTRTKRLLSPPNISIEGIHLVFYPMALVHLEMNGKDELLTYDFYRGALDKSMMWYLKLRDKIMDTDGILFGPE